MLDLDLWMKPSSLREAKKDTLSSEIWKEPIRIVQKYPPESRVSTLFQPHQAEASS
ncbi:hypothetical protein QQ045_021462 [Rhodiola kirilowii]